MQYLPKPHISYDDDFQIKATFGIGITAILVLTPFIFISLVHGRNLLAGGLAVIVALLAFITLTIHRGRYSANVMFFCVIPLSVIFLNVGLEQLGITGLLWCYPVIVAYYFTLPEKKALASNLVLLLTLFPHAWYILEPVQNLRVIATMLGVSALSYIFLRMVISQQARIQRNENFRRESMASVSHELRTPIATAITQVDAMLDGIRPFDNKQLQTLSRSLVHLGKIVDDLYQLALADVGALNLNKDRTGLGAIILDALDAARNKMGERLFVLNTDIDEGIDIYGDAKYMRQIIDNLLANCYRYSTPAATITIQLYQEKGWANLVISDSGPGVNDDTLAALFERFHRGDPSRSRDSGGSGLGLALVKAMTEAHGGTVEAFHANAGGLGIRIRIPMTHFQPGQAGDKR